MTTSKLSFPSAYTAIPLSKIVDNIGGKSSLFISQIGGAKVLSIFKRNYIYYSERIFKVRKAIFAYSDQDCKTMNFTVPSSELLSKLQIAGGAINSNPVIPILEDFLFEIQGSNLTITATNLETTIITQVAIDATEEGRIAIPGKILMDTLKALPGQPVKFAVNMDNFGIKITSNYGTYKLAGRNPEDYPSTPAESDVQELVIPAETLKRSLARTTFATSNDELRLAMMGVNFNVNEGALTMVATDAHKLVRFILRGLKTESEGSFIVPKKSLSLLNNAVMDQGSVDVSYNATNAFFSYDDTKVICRLIDARFPDYNAVIPANNELEMIVDRADLLQSLKRIAIYANKSTNQVVFQIQEGSLTVSSQDLDFSNEANEQLSCSFNHDSLEIGFNAKFLIEMLSILETKDVHFFLSEPNKAGILVPAENPEGEDLLMLVMPVMMGY